MVMHASALGGAHVVCVVALSGFPLHANADHLAGGVGVEGAGAIVTESAEPLARGRWNVGVRTEYVDNAHFGDAELIRRRGRDIDRDGEADEDLHSVASILGVTLTAAFGLTDALTVGLRLPYVRRHDIREPDEGHAHDGGPIVVHDIIAHGDSAGIGDLTLSGVFRVYAHDDHHVAALFGLKTPTGETRETGFVGEREAPGYTTSVIPGDEAAGHRHAGRRLETHQQPGSGSWDGLLGLAYGFHPGNVHLEASLVYTLVTEGAQDTALGDAIGYGLAISRPTVQWAPCAFCSWDLILEFNGEWRGRESRSGREIGNSGGHVLYLSPGLRLALGDGLNLGVSVGVPVARDLNGRQSEPGYRLIGAVNYGF